MNKALRYEVEAILREVVSGPVHSLALRAAKALPKIGKKAKPSFRKAKKKAIKEGAKIARQAVRLACELRANGKCEACGMTHSSLLELDHFYGRAFSESVETCWLIGARCHKMKTENWPSRAYWDDRFARFCRRNGYPFKPRLTKDIQVRHRRQRSPENPPSPLVAPSGLIKEHT